jgi:hemerythrin
MYKFNDAGIDAEHDFIISRFSDLCKIVSIGEYDLGARRELLGIFLHYTSDHFHREEALMQEAGYPRLEQHAIAHAYMQDEFGRRLGAMSGGSPNLQTDLCLLRQMFLHHILTFDEALGEWLAKGNPTRAPRPCILYRRSPSSRRRRGNRGLFSVHGRRSSKPHLRLVESGGPKRGDWPRRAIRP